MEGWIKLHRKLQEKALWQCTTPEQKVILITILLNANHEVNEWEWQGKRFTCEPGQMVTSLASLAEKCGKGITVQNVRTALEKFEKYGFLTNQSTKTGRLITVVNWTFYQDSSCEVTKQPTKHQQSSNKEVTTNKNDKNDKNNNIYNAHFVTLWSAYPKKADKAAAYKQYQARLKDGYSEEELLQAVERYAAECKRENREQRYIKHCKTFLGVNGSFTEYLKTREDERSNETENKTGDECANFYERYYRECDQS